MLFANLFICDNFLLMEKRTVEIFRFSEITEKGKVAEKWMSIAQCFAGPPEDPPIKGSRYIKEI